MSPKLNGAADLGTNPENLSTRELISIFKTSFRESDFAKVESILVARYDKLKQDLETTEQANEWLTEKLELDRMDIHNEMEHYKTQCCELKQQLREEKDVRKRSGDDRSAKLLEGLKRGRDEDEATIADLRSKISELESDKGKVEKESEDWKTKYQQTESRILKLLEDYQLLKKGMLSRDSNVRVSVKDEIDCKENIVLPKANVGLASTGNGRLPLRGVIDIDSD